MAERKNPTNKDILIELRNMNQRLVALENWKIAEDAAKAAIEKYKAQEVRSEAKPTSEGWLNRELVKTLVTALGIIGALVALIQASQ